MTANDVETQGVKKQTVEVRRRALELGFSAVGIATLEASAHGDFIDRWLAAGYGGTMTYLNRQAAKRKDPRAILPNARCAVVTLTNYYHGPVPTSRPRVAQYAWSPDYHRVLGERLQRLAAEIAHLVPGSASRAYVDAGPSPSASWRNAPGWAGSGRTPC